MSLSSWAAAVVAGLALSWPGATHAQSSLFKEVPGVRELSGQVLVRPIQAESWLTQGRAAAAAEALVTSARNHLAKQCLRVLPGTDIHVLRTPPGSTDESFCSQLMATGLYEFAAPDWIVYPLEGTTRPDDPLLRAQWHIDRVNAPRAWNATTGNGSITCAFVDTGVDVNHPDLASLLVPGFNAVSNTPQVSGGLVTDVNGHGTGVAGAAVAMGNNAVGGSGMCWSARIMPIRATNYSSGAAFMSNILYGASWAAFNGAKVVSVSYAGIENPSVEPTGQVIMNSYGGLLVWAAGNSTANLSTFDYEATTIVGSTSYDDSVVLDSNYGRAIDIMAPGVAIWVPAPGGVYMPRSGTSFAAPVAAGVLALAWSAKPSMTPAQAMSVLYQSCQPLEPVSPSNNTGWGRVDAAAAVQLAMGRPVPRDPEFMPAAALPSQIEPGLEAKYFSATGMTSLMMPGGLAIGNGVVPLINFPGGPGFNGCPWNSNFAATLKGYILIPTTGVYTFTLDSKDGSRLVIDGKNIADNDGIHARQFRSGTAYLERGLHHVECDYFTTSNQPTLVLQIRGMGMGNFTVPASMFTRTPRAILISP